MESVKIIAPASVANVSCGYDIFGFAIEGLGDVIELTKRGDDQLVISNIEGADLPVDPTQNIATVAMQSLLDHLQVKQGLDVSIKKLTPPCSGLGSSASSASGAVFALSELLETGLTKDELLPFAVKGEMLASKKIHADNVAPALFGGFNVVRSCVPTIDVFQVHYPAALQVLIIYPHIKISTAQARAMLGTTLELSKAREQWGNVAGLVSGLIMENWDLISRSMVDVVAEPVRKALIPNYDKVKEIALRHGAVGFNISGSGPAMFGFFEGDVPEQVIRVIQELYQREYIQCDVFTSPINESGAQRID